MIVIFIIIRAFYYVLLGSGDKNQSTYLLNAPTVRTFINTQLILAKFSVKLSAALWCLVAAVHLGEHSNFLVLKKKSLWQNESFCLRWTGSGSHSSNLKVNWVAELPPTENKVLNSVQTSLEGTEKHTKTEADQPESWHCC